MGLLDRFRRRWRRQDAESEWSEEDIPAFLEAMQPIAAAETPRQEELAALRSACSAHADLRAVYIFDSDFAGQGQSLVTVGLVLDLVDSDPERFVEVSQDLEPHLEQLFGDNFISQLLDAHSLDRVRTVTSPVYERP
jgi:hypothetical protein